MRAKKSRLRSNLRTTSNMLSYIPGMSCILTTIFVNLRGFEFSTGHPLQKQQLMKVSSVLVSLDKASEQKR